MWINGGTKPVLCEDCAEEVVRQEKLADQLAELQSCQERERILDTSETSAEIVNGLRAHAMGQCADCATVALNAVRKRESVSLAPSHAAGQGD